MSTLPRSQRGHGLIAPLIVGAIVLATIALISTVVLRNQQPSAPLPLSNPDEFASMVVPAFELVDQDGNAVDNSILQGQHTVVEFMFSHCQLVCPIMKSNLLPAASALKGKPVRFVSFSVDPVHDTPEHLRAYADKLGIDTQQWSLVTGEPGVVRDIVASMGFAPPTPDGKASNLIDLGNGQTMENIIHPTRFIVFNPQGQIVGLYRGVDQAESRQMIEDLKRAVR